MLKETFGFSFELFILMILIYFVVGFESIVFILEHAENYNKFLIEQIKRNWLNCCCAIRHLIRFSFSFQCISVYSVIIKSYT